MSQENQDRPAAESVRVNIFGQTYSLRSTGGGERVRDLAALVDGRMREIAAQLAVHDAAKVAVLAALNFADELRLVREHYEREIESLLARDEAAASPPAAAEVGADRTGHPGGPPAAGEHAEADTSREGSGAEDAGARGAGDARRSWFDDIFDTEFSSGGQGRLSSQVSTRLQRLRQATSEGTVSDGGRDES